MNQDPSNELVSTVRARLESSGLCETVAALIAEAEKSFVERREQLIAESQRAAPSIRPALTQAADAFATAARATSEPVRQAIGIVVLRMLTDQGIELSPTRGAEKAKRTPKGPSRNGQGEDAALLALAAESPAGFSTSDASTRLGTSPKVARRLCERMVHDGKLRHNGKARQESRYHGV